MSNEIEFINGLSFKAPNEGAPEYVKAKGSIKRADLIEWLQAKEGDWVNFDLKVSNAGKWYAAVDNWKPNGKPAQPDKQAARAGEAANLARGNQEPEDDIPF